MRFHFWVIFKASALIAFRTSPILVTLYWVHFIKSRSAVTSAIGTLSCFHIAMSLKSTWMPLESNYSATLWETNMLLTPIICPELVLLLSLSVVSVPNTVVITSHQQLMLSFLLLILLVDIMAQLLLTKLCELEPSYRSNELQTLPPAYVPLRFSNNASILKIMCYP